MASATSSGKDVKGAHFVPRMYLKRFSPTWESNHKKELSYIFLSSYNRPVPDLQSYAKHCTKYKFYGEDGTTETFLQRKEAEWDHAIRHVVSEEPLTNDDEQLIREFVIYQLYRTPTWIDTTNKLMQAYIDWAARNILDDELREEYTSPLRSILEQLDPARYIERGKEQTVATQDLKLAFARCETEVELITSDAPVLVFNPYAWGATTLDAIGIMLICPLDPCHFVIMYDEGIYQIKPPSNGCIYITDDNTIQMLNCYQYLMSGNVLFSYSPFTGNEFVDDIKQLREQVKEHRQYKGEHSNELLDDIYNEAPQLKERFHIEEFYTISHCFIRVKEMYRTVFERQRPSYCQNERAIKQSVLQRLAKKKIFPFENKKTISALSHEEKMALCNIARAFEYYWEQQEKESI